MFAFSCFPLVFCFHCSTNNKVPVHDTAASKTDRPPLPLPCGGLRCGALGGHHRLGRLLRPCRPRWPGGWGLAGRVPPAGCLGVGCAQLENVHRLPKVEKVTGRFGIIAFFSFCSFAIKRWKRGGFPPCLAGEGGNRPGVGVPSGNFSIWRPKFRHF